MNAGPAAHRTVVADVRVFDGEKLLEPGTVVIDGTVIGTAADADGARRIDGRGGVLLPGLIDTHVHLTDLSTLRAFASYGVTTVLDMGTWPAEKVDALRGRTGLTDIRSATVGATSPDSAHGQRLRPEGGLVGGPDEAEGYVDRRVAEGADYIKIIIDLPGFDQATVDALVAAAHRHGMRTVVHASSLEAFRMAQHAGADVLTHAPLDRPVTEEDVARALAGHRVVSPTLAMMEAIVAAVGRPGAPGPSYEAARASVAALHRAGVPILAGSDANDAKGVPATPPFGDSLHRELELLTGAGLSTVEALRAATVVAARCFGLTDRGVIEPGRRADLLLVSGDPVADIRATRNVERVWCAGVEFDASRPNASRPNEDRR
ncbi:amidohydrolase family protein [Streptomyces sp. NPDC014748]|uniref:amidohydrolase family protein n=1 Tax=Streptomyces sp. NPDC014748 TaxID=3364905 RepID=UPI00370064B8